MFRRAFSISIALVAVVGCSTGFDTLAGRETCWAKVDQRIATLWRGVLGIDASGAHLDTPEGEAVPLLPGSVEVRGATLVQGTDVVATVGDDITVFGGAGGDGAIVVCAIEENRGGS